MKISPSKLNTPKRETMTERHNFREKCVLIRETLDKIKADLPPDPNYHEVRILLNSQLTRLSYTAPEVIGLRWLELYEILKTRLNINLNTETHCDTTMKASYPVWITSITRLWNENNQKFRQLCPE